MDETKINEPVPYIVYESERARAERLLKDERERSDKRLKEERELRRKDRIIDAIICILLIITLIGYIAYDKWQESKYETSSTTTYEYEQDTDGGGSNNFYGGDYYGAPESKSNGN